MASIALGLAVALLGASALGAFFTFLGRRDDDVADDLYAVADAEDPFSLRHQPRLRIVSGPAPARR